MQLLVPALLISVIVATRADAFECNVCHSKNPAMVRMHQALKGQSCFACHKMGEKLMGKGQPKDKESLLKRRQTEDVCLPCHTKPTEHKETIHGSDSATQTAR